MTGIPLWDLKIGECQLPSSNFEAMRRNERLLSFDDANALLKYDDETGFFTWRERPPISPANRRFNTIHAGEHAGRWSERGYLRLRLRGRQYQASRVAWLLKTGAWPEHRVDHRDGDSRNNRWSNLRAATSIQNAQNRALSCRNASKRTGVRFLKHAQKWNAVITVNYRNIYLGRFDRFEDAVSARESAELKYFGEFSTSASREIAS